MCGKGLPMPYHSKKEKTMAKYLDPKADLTFKKVFGEHKNLVISFLNALLPLDKGKKIKSIEYLPSEMTPRTPFSKDTTVDVRCEETGGRKFIVEMQMNWSANFKQRVLFNAAKAYVRQMPKGKKYHLLQPVYSLNLVNDTFEPKMDGYYHYYSLVHYLNSKKTLDGLHLVFVELPKFKAKNLTEMTDDIRNGDSFDRILADEDYGLWGAFKDQPSLRRSAYEANSSPCSVNSLRRRKAA